jgi:membrane-associated protein
VDKEVYKFYKCRKFFFGLSHFAGHYLYGFLLENYQIDLKEHIEVIVIVLVIITLSPVLLKFAKNAKNED